jgi:hypothetical protein
VSGLASIHEETLREINRTLTWIIVNENYRNIQNLIRKTFAILKERSHDYAATALNCILNTGKGVYKTQDVDLVNFFIDALIDFGFQAPMLRGVDDQWQIRANSAHLLNIRTWLALIKLNPKQSTRLLSALIVHLSLSGVFLRDIDNREPADQEFGERPRVQAFEKGPGVLHQPQADIVGRDLPVQYPGPGNRIGHGLGQEIVHLHDLDATGAHLVHEVEMVTPGHLDPQDLVEQQVVVIARGESGMRQSRRADHDLAQGADLGMDAVDGGGRCLVTHDGSSSGIRW